MVISAGCGASGSGGEGTSDSSDSGEVTITIPSYKTGENVGAVFFEPQVERFNEAYEGQYHIELENVTEECSIQDGQTGHGVSEGHGMHSLHGQFTQYV